MHQFLRLLLSMACLLPFGTLALAQTPTTVGLVALYGFDASLADGTGNTSNGGVASGIVEFGCGVRGSAAALSGGNDFVRIPGGDARNNVNAEFDTEDFTVSLYFKPTGTTGNQFLLAKRDTNCNNNQYFLLRYAPRTRTVSVTLRENAQSANVTYAIDNTSCWQHVAVVRDELRVRLYVNGAEVGEAGTQSRVNVDNAGPLLIGSATCRNSAERPFSGLIDEVRVYNRALRNSEVAQLYFSPDRIVNTPDRVFLGESIDVSLNSNCGVAFDWEPAAGVDAPDEAEPTITPTAAGEQTYRVSIADAETECVATDELTLQVIDPNTLDCGRVFLPKAFTPNGIGPAENETFGISNPFAIPELVSFEIYDRYGGRVFAATDAFARWDGSFRGQPVNPGIFLWRVVYRCAGQELVQTESVTVLR